MGSFAWPADALCAGARPAGTGGRIWGSGRGVAVRFSAMGFSSRSRSRGASAGVDSAGS